MTDPDTSKIEAVNSLLAIIGEAPVNSIDTNPTEDVSMALRVLDEVDREVQGLGWFWNTHQKVTIQAQGGEFGWLPEWHSFDLEEGRYPGISVVRRGEKLFNVLENTSTFTQTELVGTAIVHVEWEDLPESARNYIMVRAKRRFATQQVDSADRSGHNKRDELDAKMALESHESKQGDHTIFSGGIADAVQRPGGGGLEYLGGP